MFYYNFYIQDVDLKVITLGTETEFMKFLKFFVKVPQFFTFFFQQMLEIKISIPLHMLNFGRMLVT